MALIRSDNPNLDRILDHAYESYVDRLWDEAYGDHGERCYNCTHFVDSYKNTPCYCNKDSIEDIEDEDEYTRLVKENTVDPDDCCSDWQPGYEWEYGDEDEPEDDE